MSTLLRIALKITCFYTLVSTYFVIYTLAIAKKDLHTLSSQPHWHPLTILALPFKLLIKTIIYRPQTSELKPISTSQLLFHWKNFEKYAIVYTLPWSRWNWTHTFRLTARTRSLSRSNPARLQVRGQVFVDERGIIQIMVQLRWVWGVSEQESRSTLYLQISR